MTKSDHSPHNTLGKPSTNSSSAFEPKKTQFSPANLFMEVQDEMSLLRRKEDVAEWLRKKLQEEPSSSRTSLFAQQKK